MCLFYILHFINNSENQEAPGWLPRLIMMRSAEKTSQKHQVVTASKPSKLLIT